MALEMTIAMLGPRGVGKTSLLTGMWQELSKINSPLPLSVVIPEPQELQAMLDNMVRLAATFEQQPLEEGTRVWQKYSFRLTAPDGRTLATLTFVDYPGGFLSDTAEARDRQGVLDLLKTSDAVVMAIDTPPMVEMLEQRDGQLVGRWCSNFNRHLHMNEVLIQAYQQNGRRPRLLILAPVKCEFHMRMGVRSAYGQYSIAHIVKDTYDPLLSALRRPENGRNIAIAITPVQTIGDYEFGWIDEKPQKDEMGTVIPGGGLVPTVEYRRIGAPARYSPKYCEQPLMHILRFAIARELERRGHPSVWSTIFSKFRRGAVSYEQLLVQAQGTLQRLTIQDRNFQIVQGGEVLVPRLDITS